MVSICLAMNGRQLSLSLFPLLHFQLLESGLECHVALTQVSANVLNEHNDNISPFAIPNPTTSTSPVSRPLIFLTFCRQFTRSQKVWTVYTDASELF